MASGNICDKCKFLTRCFINQTCIDAYCMAQKPWKLVANNINEDDMIESPEWCINKETQSSQKDETQAPQPKKDLSLLTYVERNKYIEEVIPPKMNWSDIKEDAKYVIPPIGYSKAKIILVTKKNEHTLSYKEVNDDSYYTYTMTIRKNSPEAILLTEYHTY